MNTQGHNNPPSDKEVFLSELEGRHDGLVARRATLIEAAGRAPETIEDAETAGKAADFIKQLTAHEKAADTARTEEKAPFLERGRWIDGWFKGPVVAGIAEVKRSVTQRLTAYQRKVAEEERRRRGEEERRQREEAERARREAEERAKAAETDADLDAAIAAEEQAAQAQAEAERAERASRAAPADLSRQHSASGTVASLRTTWKCTSFSHPEVDLEALRDYLTHADIEKAIRAFVRAGGRELRGATIQEVAETRVA